MEHTGHRANVMLSEKTPSETDGSPGGVKYRAAYAANSTVSSIGTSLCL